MHVSCTCDREPRVVDSNGPEGVYIGPREEVPVEPVSPRSVYILSPVVPPTRTDVSRPRSVFLLNSGSWVRDRKWVVAL